MVAPCKGCTDRKIGCHSECKKYISFIEYRHYVKHKQEVDREAMRSTPLKAKKTKFNSLKTFYQ